MKTKFISVFLLLAVSVGNLFASVQVGDLYYDLEASTLTAQVTFKSYKSSTWSYNENWSITSASIPSSITYQGKTYQVTSIGDHAFYNCTGLTSVTIGNSVTSIGNYAFYECSSLTSVTIGNSVTSIGNYAFRGCSGLTSITIPNSVTSIEYKAFYDCSGLTKITIPTSVTSIGEFAFSGCNNITSVIWNAKNCSDFSISEYAPFNYISSQITSLTFGEEVEHIPAHLCSTMSNLTSVTIPNSVTSIGDRAFSGCSGLTSVNITDIAAWCNIAFSIYDNNPLYYAKHLYVNNVEVTNLVIPEGVTSIGNYAFYECSGLTSVTIPNNVTSIGGWAFYKCTGLTSVTIGNSVTSIGDLAFSGCTGLTSVTIGNSVTSIGKYAFHDCTSLTSVTIPNSVTSIGNDAFCYVLNIVYNGTATGSPWGAKSMNGYVDGYLVYSDATKTVLLGCSSKAIGEIVIPNSVTSIGKRAFYGCSGLTSVMIGNSVTYIGESAFYYCNGLTSVTIPNSVTYIGSSAFRGCSGLTSVTIPNSVTRIGESAFRGCSGLTSVTIPNSVTRIGESAFYYCSGLTSVTIGNSVTYIGESAFYGCSGLTSVTNFANTPQEITSSVFDKVDKSTCVLYVPAGSISAYKSANQWKDFSNILPIGAQPADVTTTTVTPSETTADIAWPQVTGAATYTIEIKKNGELICTLTFNAQGQLISIAFNAPSRNNAPQQAQAAGFSFTVTSLDSGTTYSYTMTAKDNNGNVLKTESGTFTTTGEPQGIEDVLSDDVPCTKVIHNGQIFILRGEKVYTLQGQEVK